ncbi:unnamed protein product [Bemisia tabaci]|uniref:BAH domain-containing protein n=1 Tax=Bemisia tabaci TaxID=7038 RepID=A0A9P0EWF5_BEMTA|nr:unnamed protein product [Bemisia tabaci]
MDDTMQESLFTERESAGTSQHSKRKGGRSRKSSATRKPDICSLVEKLISIEERSKKVVKKSPHRERIKKVRRWLKSERKKKYKKAVVADSNVTTDVDKLITKFNSFTIVEKNPHLTRASNHIIKSKFSCKCCSDNDPDRPFSKSKKKKWSSRRKDTSSEQRTAKHLLLGKKKMKKNIDLRNEKYDRRLPLKKRLYRIAANSCTKTDSAGIATDVAQDINGKTISPTIPVPEENKEISCQSSSENSDETRIIPVTPKKRFQNKRQNVPNSETFSISPPLRSGSQCNDMITHSQVQVDLSTCKQTLQVKLSKISDEICKKMKSVTLLPSNDLKVSSSSSKDLNKVSKHRRNIPSAEQSNLNLEVKFDPIRNLTKDLNKCGTIDDTETYSPKTKEKQVSIPKADSDDNCSIDQKDQATQFIRKTTSVSNDCHTVPIESVTSSKNRKKRKRTINRTGFPTKKKKKKSNTSNETNVKEKTLSAKLHIGSKDPVRHGETIVLTPLTTDKIKHFPSTSKFFPEPSCFVENGSNLVNGQHVVPNSGEENVENVSFLGTTLHQQINPSTQNRRVSLRARPRQRRDSLLLAEANKKSCDKKTKHETRLQDFHELMERSKLIIAEKKYLQAGLFSDQFKVNDVEIDSCCEQKNCELDVSSLPSLSYYAERVRQKTDFTLPFDVWASHRAPKTLTRIKSNRNEYSKECDDSGSGSDLNEDMSDTFDGSNPSFSFFLPRKLHAFGSEGRTTTLLTDEQSKFIRANSCFLIRNLIKVQAIVVDKNNSASSNRGNELKLNIKSDASTKKLETISQTLQSFQKLKETSKEINNLQQDASMESKECNRNLLSEEKSKLKFENSASCNCSSQFVENHTSSRRTQSSRKLFSGNDANKSCSQILVSGTPETSIEVGLTQMGNGQKYFKALTSENCIIQTGENVYITKDNSELKLDETVATSIFGRADCNVFHIERLWRDENNDGYAFGYYFLRPHETFHEPSRRFFPNELMKSPLCETIPISRIVGHCHVLNLSSYCREKPASADLDHIFICEYRVDKGAKTFSRIPKRKACFSSDETTEFHLPPLKPVRNFKPYDATSNFRKIKKQHKTLKHTDTNEISGVYYVGGSHRSTSLANYSTDEIDERTQQQQPHSITSKISRTEDYAF